jgi:hypothetical protein
LRVTPLAFELMRDLTTPCALHVRDYRDWSGREPLNDKACRAELWKAANESQFFELSAIASLCEESGEKMRAYYENSHRWNSRLAFLPAVKTWIEFDFGVDRQAYCLDSGDDPLGTAHFAIIARRPHQPWTFWRLGDIGMVKSEEKPHTLTCNADNGKRKGEASELQFLVYAALAFINSPRIIGRRQHMPHERAERERLKSRGLAGKFPLRAWTEIILKVMPPDDKTGEPSQEAHLTGERCLHFVRTFLRVRLGQLEYVNCHWRGDPALGMKRSRYILRPEERA